MNADDWEVTPLHLWTCSIPVWYPLFRKVSIRSLIIPLPPSVIAYLQDDSIVLPQSNDGTLSVSDDSDEDDVLDSSPSLTVSFPEFQSKVAQAIKQLGGRVFPKLNWSCPKDASWIMPGGTLMCQSLNDILLLLKSSDYIVHDMDTAFDTCMNNIIECMDFNDLDAAMHGKGRFCLVLRKWSNLHPGMEFRCFVCHLNLIGISQRDDSNYYPFLSSADQRVLMVTLITTFFQQYLKHVVDEKLKLYSFVFDCFIDRDDRVWLIDINPFYTVTRPLLFSWEELLQQRDSCELRCVDTQQGIRFSDEAISKVPLDVVRAYEENLQNYGGVDGMIALMRKHETSLDNGD